MIHVLYFGAGLFIGMLGTVLLVRWIMDSVLDGVIDFLYRNYDDDDET